MGEHPDVIVVGAGMGGLVLAELLARKNLKVTVLERQPSYTPPVRGELLQPNGLRILDQLGLLPEIISGGSQENRIFHFFRIGSDRLCTIDYGMLPPPYNFVLMTLPEIVMGVLLKKVSANKNIVLHWGAEFNDLIWSGDRVVGLKAIQNGMLKNWKAPLVVGADGIFSRVREKMRMPFRLKMYKHGYLTLFVNRPQRFPDEGRYYVGKNEILGLFPIFNRLYLFYLVPSTRLRRLGRPDHWPEADLRILKQALASIDPLLHDSLTEVKGWVQVGYMPCCKVQAGSWVAEGVTLIGDAAHAMNPHVSQGRNQSLEDAVLLAEVAADCFRRNDFSKSALSAYEGVRRPFVERLQRLADEEVFFWNAGDRVRTWLRDRTFRVLERNPRLRYKMLAQVAGISSGSFSLLDYLQAAGFFPDRLSGRY